MVQRVQDRLPVSCVHLSLGRDSQLSSGTEKGPRPTADQASLFRQLPQVGTSTPVSSLATVLPKPLMPRRCPSPTGHTECRSFRELPPRYSTWKPRGFSHPVSHLPAFSAPTLLVASPPLPSPALESSGESTASSAQHLSACSGPPHTTHGGSHPVSRPLLHPLPASHQLPWWPWKTYWTFFPSPLLEAHPLPSPTSPWAAE